MNKKMLVKKIASDAGISRDQATAVLDSFTDAVVRTLKKEHFGTLVGFGSFSLLKKSARNGSNPQTGEPIRIKAKRTARFTASPLLSFKL
jgi:DNA-binding protein HU-beta